MNLWHDLKTKNKDGSFNAVVEIPNGSNNKYELDLETGLLKLEKILQPKQYFIFDYGFLPRTLGGDNDPLDVVILSSNKLVVNLIVEVMPIGLMKMIDEGDSDDKVIAVVKDDFYWNKNISNKKILKNKYKEIEEWFKIYKGIDGTPLKINGFKSKKEALKSIDISRENYKKMYKTN